MTQTFGIDVVEVERIRSAGQDATGLLAEFFTAREISECRSRRHPHASLAACLAVKEALLKAAGIGLNEGLLFRDIEVFRQDSGIDRLQLRGRMKEIIGNESDNPCLVSSAYTDDLACAVVALQHKGTE